jgi:hypothetical protein
METAIIVAVTAGFLTFISNIIIKEYAERKQRKSEELKLKIERYTGLIYGLRGFAFRGVKDDELSEEFMHHLNLSYMYCSDEVIKKCNKLIDTINGNNTSADRDLAIGEILITIRKELSYKNTSLTKEDFKNVTILSN